MVVKILHYQYVSPNTEGSELQDGGNIGENNTTTYAVSLDATILKLSVSTPWKKTRFEGSIELDLSSSNLAAYEIMLRESTVAGELSSYPIFGYVDRDTGLRNVNYTGKKVARIVIDEDVVWVYLCIPCDAVPGFENEIITGEQSSTGILISKCSWLNEHYAKVRKKSALINNVDSNKSLAYLEAQVDLLTRIIISIAPESTLLNVLKLADKYSVLNIKPVDALISEFSQNKAELRGRQEVYYERITNNTGN